MTQLLSPSSLRTSSRPLQNLIKTYVDALLLLLSTKGIMLGIDFKVHLYIINNHVVGKNVLINRERVLPHELEVID
jgi:hypothetical protein